MLFVSIVLIFAQAFLLGSIPWGVVLSKLFYHDDVRQHGSGNIGTTNMIRTYGKKLGYICFVGDFVKALVACLLAVFLAGVMHNAGWVSTELYEARTLVAVGALGAVMGHVFCPWLGFKGGKGIASGVACVFVMYGLFWGFAELALFAVLVVATRYVSVGSIAAAAAFPFVSLYLYWGNPVAIIICTILGGLVVWSHRSNIKRLMEGTESKIGSKKTA